MIDTWHLPVSVWGPTPFLLFFFLNDTAPTKIYPLSLHAALPIFPEGLRERRPVVGRMRLGADQAGRARGVGLVEGLRRRVGGHATADNEVGVVGHRAWALLRSEEHTSELQSRSDIVCRLLLGKKK